MFQQIRHMGRAKPAVSKTPVASTSQRKTFFDLPAELRNTIYELVADSTLYFNSQRTSKASTGPGLLITSRQCRVEYLSIMLATAPIKVSITDMNFTKLLDLLSTLHNTFRKALCTNTQLHIHLHIRKCGSDVYANLRTWCEAQSTLFPSGEGLPQWKYAMDRSTPAKAAQLDWYCRRVVVLEQRLPAEAEVAKAEAGKVLKVLEGERTGIAAGMGSWSMGRGEAWAVYAATSARRT